jgi:hypothetical protein
MPNRKTFDAGEKYDHSSHPVTHGQPSDLKPDIKDDADSAVEVEPNASARRPSRNATIHLPRGRLSSGTLGKN